MPSFPHYTQEIELKFRQFIRMRVQNVDRNEIMTELGISEKTYYNWLKKDRDELPLFSQEKAGRKRLTTEEDDDIIVEVCKQNRRRPLKAWRSETRLQDIEGFDQLSDNYIYKRLNQRGLKQHPAIVKPFLNENQKMKRLQYAQKRANWDEVEWSNIIFIDEFGICTADTGRVKIWRMRGERFNDDCIVESTKNLRKTFSFIVSFSAKGIGPLMRINGNFNSQVYIQYLEMLKPYINQHFNNEEYFILHDGHKCHSSAAVKKYMLEDLKRPYDLLCLDHPANSPDLNPDEHVGEKLKRLVRKIHPCILSEAHLWDALNEAYDYVKEDRRFFLSLIESMPRRIKQVLDKNGGHTSY